MKREFDLNDVYVIEGEVEADELEEAMALQRAINGGLWGLQGSYGRAMMEAIEAGVCMLGNAPARDYYGNRIPSRHEVKEGSKGSRGYVVEAMGEEWAKLIEEV